MFLFVVVVTLVRIKRRGIITLGRENNQKGKYSEEERSHNCYYAEGKM